ncbi:MAG: HD domain-containing protein [Clostridiales bacterium]|nr:HD domain-containing protein [Clostridiales bacterium]
MVFGIMARAVEYNGNDAARIHHLIRVHSFARIIGKADHFDENHQKIAELAAVLHDIGIHNCEKKYHSTDGKYQEIEGELVAREILEEYNVPEWITDRVCYIVGHHHTLSAIDGLDFQAVVEADILVNIFDKKITDKERIALIRDKIFRTKKGKQLIEQMYLSGDYSSDNN